MLYSLLFVACGIVLLVVGADALVSGASRIAQRFGCLGLAGLVAPAGLEAPIQLIRRQEGVLLLFWSAVYLIWTVLTATANPHLSLFSDIMLLGLLPATVLFLGTTVVIALHGSRQQP